MRVVSRKERAAEFVRTKILIMEDHGLAQIAFAQIFEIVLCVQLLAGDSDQQVVRVQQRTLSKEGGVYPLMYYTHNIHFLCVSEMIEGRRRDALRDARLLETKVPLNAVREMPMAEFLVPMPYLVEARFGQWDLILTEPAPPKDLPFTTVMWHYVRGLAFSAKGRRSEAALEESDVANITAVIPPDRPLGTSNRAKNVAAVAEEVLAGEMASIGGDRKAAIEKFTRAVRLEDALIYEEPPMWYAPVRERLATELLAAGRRQDAVTVYREDLKINPGNP
jgi:hypothetical protein